MNVRIGHDMRSAFDGAVPIGAGPFSPCGVKAFLIVNPASGGYARQKIAGVVDALRSAGIQPRLFTAVSPAEAAECCRTIYWTCGEPLVIVAAGDGTVNAILNGLRPATATLAVLPLGTSNVLAAEIGIRSVRDGLDRIVGRRTRGMSIGVMEREGSSLRFALMAGCGLDGAVVRDVRPKEKRLLKQGAFAIATIRNCLTWDIGGMEVTTSTGTVTCHSVVVSNAARYGGNFILAPHAELFSPGFTVTCVTGRQRRTYAGILLDLARGRGPVNHALHQVTTTDVLVEGTKPIQVDGDFAGTGPARLRAVADFVELVV